MAVALLMLPRSSAIPITKSAPGARGALNLDLANPQGHDRNMHPSSLDSDSRPSIGSLGSSMSNLPDVDWDLPPPASPGISSPLLNDRDLAQISQEFAVEESLTAEKKSMQMNMDLIGGIVAGLQDDSDDDEMRSVWSDCYFSFGSVQGDRPALPENTSMTKIMLPSPSAQAHRNSSERSPVSARPSRKGGETKRTISRCDAASEAKSFWTMRNRSCCGWGSSGSAEKPLVKGEYPSDLKKSRKQGTQNTEQREGVCIGHSILRSNSSSSTVDLQPSPIQIVAVPLNDDGPDSDVEMRLD